MTIPHLKLNDIEELEEKNITKNFYNNKKKHESIETAASLFFC